MIARRLLPNRRSAETFNVQVGTQRYVVTVGRFADGTLAELFISNGKCGSDSDACARDSAIAASLALQHGTPPDVIRRALLRDARGGPCTPLCAALDRLVEG